MKQILKTILASALLFSIAACTTDYSEQHDAALIKNTYDSQMEELSPYQWGTMAFVCTVRPKMPNIPKPLALT